MEVKGALALARMFSRGCGDCEALTCPPTAFCGCPGACWMRFRDSLGFPWPATGWWLWTESPLSPWWGYSSSSWRGIPGSVTASWGTSRTGWSGWFTGVSRAVSRTLQISNTGKLIVLAVGLQCFKTLPERITLYFQSVLQKLSNRSN